ncbi:hypothetical protein [Crossiella cryophila]|uniref:Uncharacterized protein n=1 Tax=Crossiella cryophila TaxID=43355 RepID=A0A7W7C427_9PSEU|nr:hypothetical protein [Crossiella cryophila]MBB4674172.1 hypothetical protein [Crossiella cryophila]
MRASLAGNVRRIGRSLVRRWYRIPVLLAVLVVSFWLNEFHWGWFNPGLLIGIAVAPGLLDWWVAGDERAADVG